MNESLPEPKGLLASIGNAIGAHVAPVLEHKLDVFTERALDMLAERLPDMAAAMAERVVKAVFDNTQIDEAADDAIGMVNDIFDNIRKGLPFGLGGR